MRTPILLGLLCVFAGTAFSAEQPWQTQNRMTKRSQTPAITVSPTSLLIVLLKPGAKLGMEYGLAQPLKSSAQWVALDAGSVKSAKRASLSLATDPRVLQVFPISDVPVVQDGFTPNDPLFPKDAPSAGFRGQWHLLNSIETGMDINVSGAWSNDVVGTDVAIALIDDGLQAGHSDLFPNYSGANSYDFDQNDISPVPVATSDNHGTAAGGIMAARGGNGIGVTGVAPFALLSAIRVRFNAATIFTQLTDATLFNSSGANTELKVKNHSYGLALPYFDATVLSTAMETSTAAGTIHVRSAGNSRGTTSEDANKYHERNTPGAITVAALANTGVFADYSNYGANVFCTAPSSPDFSSTDRGIMTTDRTGSFGYNGSGDTLPDEAYTSIYGGTSAAAPQVAGVMALVKQVQPNLNTRLAKHLLVRTSKQVDPLDSSPTGGWVTNSAGYKFNSNYGFGLIDATALVNLAPTFSGVTALQTRTASSAVAVAIPNGTGQVLDRTFNINDTTPLEEIQVSLNITHPWRGDVEASLISPTGTTHRFLTEFGGDDGDNINWTFTSNAFWGEVPTGLWRLRLKDSFNTDAGTLNSYSVTFRMGTPIVANRTVSGTVDLLDYTADAGKTVDFELMQGATVAETKSAVLGSGGTFSFTTLLSGTYDIRAKGRTWLKKKLTGINLTADVSGLAFALENGDVNGDNVIDLTDYTYVAVNFNKVSTDADWSTPNGSGIMPKDSDMNGDDVVDLTDYTIVAIQFNKIGD